MISKLKKSMNDGDQILVTVTVENSYSNRAELAKWSPTETVDLMPVQGVFDLGDVEAERWAPGPVQADDPDPTTPTEPDPDTNQGATGLLGFDGAEPPVDTPKRKRGRPRKGQII